MERATKLARLEAFRRNKPTCSASAMSAILEDVARDGLPPLMSRANMKEARDMMANTETPYGKLIQSITAIDKTNNPKEVYIADPFASLWLFCKKGVPEGAPEGTGFRDFTIA